MDTTFLNVPRSNMEIQSYMKDGMIDNWDLFEKVLDHTYNKVSFVRLRLSQLGSLDLFLF